MRLRCVVVSVFSLVLWTGCRDPEVRAYRVPKEKLPEPAVASAAGAGANPHGSPHGSPHGGAEIGAALSWQAPAHWEEKPAGGFRRGSFRIAGEGDAEADFSIIAFPGSAGGMVENFNRWRAQLGLPPAGEADVSASIEHVDVPSGLHFDVINLVGTAEGRPTRILGAVVEHGGQSWFFKLIGPDELVARERQPFLAFLQTVTPAPPAP